MTTGRAARDSTIAGHVARDPDEVDEQQTFRARGDRGLDAISGDVARRRVAVDEHRPRADPLDRVRRRHVRLRRHDHLVAGAESEVQAREVQRRHAGADRHRVGAGAHERRELGLERLALRPVREDVALEDPLHLRAIRIGHPGAREWDLRTLLAVVDVNLSCFGQRPFAAAHTLMRANSCSTSAALPPPDTIRPTNSGMRAPFDEGSAESSSRSGSVSGSRLVKRRAPLSS